MKEINKHYRIRIIILLTIVLFVSFFILTFIYSFITRQGGNSYSSFVEILINKFTNQPKKEIKIEARPEKNIQILEAWTNKDIAEYLSGLGVLSKNKFFAVVGRPQIDHIHHEDYSPAEDWSIKFSFLQDKPKDQSLEGYLFPDTYRIYATSSAKEIVRKMLNNFDKKLSPTMRSDIKKQHKTIYEVITMASIIEKEAPLNYQKNDNKDARIISGIFWHRLKIGQALQSDATLSYILDDKQPSHTAEDLDIDSPYNTYKYRGLPPGPIDNPGLLAIKAAIYPIDSDYNYFLTPKNENTVIYAKTYAQHLRNKYKYLR